MAYGRYLHKKISVSEQFWDLSSDTARLLFSLSILHTDDVGLLPYSTRTLKATIVPMASIADTEFSKLWMEIVDKGLITEFSCGQFKYWRSPTFFMHQRLRHDRQPNTVLKDFQNEETPLKSWQKLLEIKGIIDRGHKIDTSGKPLVNQRHTRRITDGNLRHTEVKRSNTNNKELASKEARQNSGHKERGKMISMGEIILGMK